MSAPWARTGAWATQVEEEEEKHGGELPAVFGGDTAFPSLGAAAQVKETKKEKKKKQSVPLGAFLAGSSARSSSRTKVLDDAAIMLQLPSGPREREEGDDGDGGSGLGGAFRDYGGDRGGARRGGFGDRDREDRFERRQEDDGPSRADEADSWGGGSKFVGGGGGGGGFGGDRRGGGGGFGDRERGERGGFGFAGDSERPPRDEGPSRADEADSWGGGSKFVGGGGGGGERSERRGFDDYGPPRGGGGFEDRPRRREYDLGSARADDADMWKRRDAPPPAERRGGDERRDRDNYTPGAADGAERWGSRRDAPPAAGDRPGSRERPKLVLKPRTAPADAPARPGSAAGSDGSAAASKPNPFGAARPREEVLKEQGRDFVKEDLELEHKTVGRSETEEEKAYRSKIESLKKQAEEEPDSKVSVEELGEEELPVKQAVSELEQRLLKLALELDDKVRFSKPPQRSSSDAHRSGGGAPREGARQEGGGRSGHAGRGVSPPPAAVAAAAAAEPAGEEGRKENDAAPANEGSKKW